MRWLKSISSTLCILCGFVFDATEADSASTRFDLIDIKIIEQSELAIGNKDAQQTILVYIRLDCVYCRQFHDEILPELKRKYIDTGYAKLVYRILSTSRSLIGDDTVSSEIIACSHKEQKLNEMLAVVLENGGHDPWENYKSWQQLAGSGDTDSFEYCLTYHTTRAAIVESQLRFERHLIRVTPTVFIGNHKLEGLKPFHVYESAFINKL
ncbi:MAG: DsbA family protein [Cyclobacteriaceae bacterium]